jgi:hypothetical protein
MGAHVIIHWRPDASLKARETILRLASEMKWRVAESSVTVVSFLAKVRKRRLSVADDMTGLGSARSVR